MKATARQLLTLVALLVIGILNSCNNQSEKATVSASREELGQMNRDFARALTAHDAAAAASLYAENASILPPNEPLVSGRDNIQKYW